MAAQKAMECLGLRVIPMVARSWLLCSCIISTHSGWAQGERGENNRIYRSAHYLGRGDTGIAAADQQEAIFYNPAGLAQGTGIYKRIVAASPQFEISSKTRSIYQDIVVDDEEQVDVLRDQVGEPFHLGANSLSALVFRRAALGALVSTNVNAIVRKDPNYGGLETVNADFNANQALTFSLAESFLGERFLVGATAKYIKRGEAGFESNIIDAQNLKDLDSDELLKKGSGYGFDLGLMVKSEKSARLTEQSFGLTVENIGNVRFKSDEDNARPSDLKQTINIGYALSVGTKLSRMRFLADYRDILGAVQDNPLLNIHLGSEITVGDYVGFSGGLNQGYTTAGMYFDIRFVRIDLGYYTEERGERVGMYADQRYFIRILAGL